MNDLLFYLLGLTAICTITHLVCMANFLSPVSNLGFKVLLCTSVSVATTLAYACIFKNVELVLVTSALLNFLWLVATGYLWLRGLSISNFLLGEHNDLR